MKNVLNIIFALAALGAVFVVAYSSYSFLTLKKQEMKNEAQFQCSQSSRYQTVDQSWATVWYPVKEMYDSCLKEKGY